MYLIIYNTYYIIYIYIHSCKVDTPIHIDTSSVYHSLQCHRLSQDPTILPTQKEAPNIPSLQFHVLLVVHHLLQSKNCQKSLFFFDRRCNDFLAEIPMLFLLNNAFNCHLCFSWLLCLSPTHWVVVLLAFRILTNHGWESSSPQFLGDKETNIIETSRSKLSNWLVISLFLNHFYKIWSLETEEVSFSAEKSPLHLRHLFQGFFWTRGIPALFGHTTSTRLRIGIEELHQPDTHTIHGCLVCLPTWKGWTFMVFM